MKNKISRLIIGICLIALFGMAGYIGGLATHSVLAPSDVRAAEDCENNVCVRRWWRRKGKCVVPVGDSGSGCRLRQEGGCTSYACG